MGFTRRVFVAWSALASAALARGRHSREARAMPASATEQGLDAKALLPLATAILPAELGAARIGRAAGAFARWIAGYREAEELVHPYGSDRIGVTGPSPAAKWAAQLAALDTAARAAHGMTFAAATRAQRTALVHQALAGVPFTSSVPAPIAAPHVALALLSHFLDSPDARNLAYNRVIDPRQCRPLDAAPNLPVVLGRGGRA